MTAGQHPPVAGRRTPAPAEVTCSCLANSLAEELVHQQRLIDRAVRGDTEAFGELYDGQVDGVYRYLLAWTQDKATAEQLTELVLRNALRWLPLIAWREIELGAWLTTMARDAVIEHRETAGGGAEPEGDPAATALPAPADDENGWALRETPWSRLRPAVARLDDEEREALILRFLLGHSVAHTAHLMGQSPGAITALQLRACASVARLLEENTL